MYSLKKFFFQQPWHYLVALVIAAAVGVFRYVTLPEGISEHFIWCEVFSVSGCVTFLIGALLTVSYFGAFDFLSYSFSPARYGEHWKHKDYIQYTEQKAAKRAKGGYYFVPYYVVGVIVFLISCIFA